MAQEISMTRNQRFRALFQPGKPFVCFDKDDPDFDAPTIRG